MAAQLSDFFVNEDLPEPTAQKNRRDRRRKPASKMVGPSVTTQVHEARKELTTAIHAEAQEETEKLVAAAAQRDAEYKDVREKRTSEAISKSKAAENARNGYHRRREDRAKRTQLLLSALPLNNKIYLYGRHHKCPHGYANSIVKTSPGSMEIKCDCEKAHIHVLTKDSPNTSQKCGCDFLDNAFAHSLFMSRKCPHCGAKLGFYHVATCGCTSVSCQRCCRRTYLYFDSMGNDITFQVFDKHIDTNQTYTLSYDVSGLLPVEVKSPINDFMKLYLDRHVTKSHSKKTYANALVSDKEKFISSLKKLAIKNDNDQAIESHFAAKAEEITNPPFTPPNPDWDDLCGPPSFPHLYGPDQPAKERPSPTTSVARRGKWKKNNRVSQLTVDIAKYIPVTQQGVEEEVEEVETKTEGGVFGTLTSVGDTTSSIKESLKKFKQSITDKLHDIGAWLLKNKILGPIFTTFLDLMRAFKTLFGYFFDIAWQLGPITLYNLWNNRNNKVVLVASLIGALMDIRRAEFLYGEKLHNFIAQDGWKNFDPRKYEFGVLTTGIKSVFGEIRKLEKDGKATPEAIAKEVSRIGFIASFYYHDGNVLTKWDRPGFEPPSDTIKAIKPSPSYPGAPSPPPPKKEEGFFKKLADLKERVSRPKEGVEERSSTKENGIMDFLSSCLNSSCAFIKKVPSNLQPAAKFLTSLFKEYAPLIMGIGALPRMADALKKITSKIWEWLFGTVNDPSAWIAKEFQTEGNPIHDYAVSYIAYQNSIFGKDQNELAESDHNLRTKYYECRQAAETYVQTNRKMCDAWAKLVAHYDKGMTIPPKPTQRPYEPTVLYLNGAAGVGKSTFWPLIVGQAIIPNLASEPDPMKTVTDATYYYNGATEFQVGMSSADIICFDDFGQDASARNENVEAMFLISLATRAPIQVNSPSLVGPEIKGCLCNPKALVLCSNIEIEVAAQKINDSEALKRRIDLGFVVTQRIDIEDLSIPCLKVTHCPLSQSMIGRILSVDEAIVLFGAIDLHKKESFMRLTNALNISMNDYYIPKSVFQKSVRPPDADKAKACWQENNKITPLIEHFIKARDSGLYTTFTNCPPMSEAFIKAFLKQRYEDKDIYPILNGAGFLRRPDGRYIMRNDLYEDAKKEGITTFSVKEAGYFSIEGLYSTISMALTTGVIIGLPLVLASTITTAVHDGAMYILTSYEGVSTLGSKAKGFLSFFIKAASAIALSFIGFKLLFGTSDTESGSSKTAMHKGKTPAMIVETTPHGGTDNNMDQIDDTIMRATGTIWREDNGFYVNVLFVGDRYILAPHHFFHDFDTNTPMAQKTDLKITKYSWNGNVKDFRFDRTQLRPLEGNMYSAFFGQTYKNLPVRDDVVVYLLDSKIFNAEKNIVNHFWSGDFNPAGRTVRKLDYQKGLFQAGRFDIYTGTVTKDKIATRRGTGDTPQIFHMVGEYDLPSREGSCGSAVRLTTANSPILGIHIAGGPQNNYFHYVTAEALRKAMTSTLEPAPLPILPTTPENGVSGDVCLPEPSCFEYLGNMVDVALPPVTTTLRRSLANEAMGPSVTEPSVLSHKDPRLAHTQWSFRLDFQTELYKHNTPAQDVGIDQFYFIALDSMKDWTREMINRSKIPTRILSDDEVLNGVPSWDQSTSVDLNTSPGYPYVNKGLKRKDLITVLPSGCLNYTQQLERDYQTALEQISNNTIPFMPFIMTIKDEKLKSKKIIPPASRLFFNGNLVHLLVCRRYFHSRLMQFYHDKFQKGSFCCPSLDRLSLDWHQLMSHMIEVGDHGFDFDFSRWDRHISKRMISDCVELLLLDLPITDSERHVLCELISAPHVIIQKKLFRATGTQVSGILVTYILNCLVNELIHRTAYLRITHRENVFLCNIRSYYQLVRGMRCGDDTITVADDRLLKIFNGLTVAAELRKMGFEVTSADKETDIVPFKHFVKLSFLKNVTSYQHGFFIPHCDKQSLFESMYYIRLPKNETSKDVALKATEANVIAALRGIFFYGPKEYQLVRDKLLLKCPALTLPTFKEIDFVWTQFYRLPGHSDYATRELTEEDPFQPNAKPHILKALAIAHGSEEIEFMPETDTTPHQHVTSTPECDEIDTRPESGKLPDETPWIELEFAHSYSPPVPRPPIQINTALIAEMDARWEREEAQRLHDANQRAYPPNNNWVHLEFAHIQEVATKPQSGIDKANIADTTPSAPLTAINSTTSDENNQQKALGSPETSQTERLGTTIEDGSQVNIHTLSVGNRQLDAYSQRAAAYLNDKSWDLSMLEEKFTQITTVDWSTSQPQGTKLVSLAIPNDILITPAQRTPFDVTKLYRFPQVRMKVIVKSSPFYQGCLVIGFSPLDETEFMLKQIQMGAIIHKLSADEGSELVIPFRHYKGFLDVSKDSIGRFTISVLNPLMVGAGNNTSISVAVYAAVEDTEFKIPEVIPSKMHKSFKFAEIETRPEAGHLTSGATPVVIGINDKLSDLSLTKMCAGIGSVVPSRVQHFQDSINDMVLLQKRFRLCSVFSTPLKPKTTSTFSAFYTDVVQVAAGPLPLFFKLFRGSVNLRFTVTPIASNIAQIFPGVPGVIGHVSLQWPDMNPNNSLFGRIEGLATFSVGEEGAVTVPYLERYFTSPYITTETSKKTVLLYLSNPYSEDIEVEIRVWCAVGDDFHTGMFIGSPERWIPPEQTINWTQANSIKEVQTKAEAGILGAISKVAINTALPFVEQTIKGLELDAEMMTIQPDPVRTKNQQFTIPCDLGIISERLFTTNHNGLNLPDKECFGTSTNETDLHNLLTNTKSWIGSFNWTMAQTKGTQLYAQMAGPSALDGPIQNILHDVIPSAFHYYTGGTIYIMDIVSSEMHTGQLVISVNYDWGSSSSVPTYKDLTQTYFTTFNLSKGRGTVAIWVPYLAPYPWTSVAGINGPTGDIPQTYATLSVFVQSPLRGTTTVANSVDVNIYKTYSADFRLGIYGNTSSVPPPSENRPAVRLTSKLLRP